MMDLLGVQPRLRLLGRPVRLRAQLQQGDAAVAAAAGRARCTSRSTTACSASSSCASISRRRAAKSMTERAGDCAGVVRRRGAAALGACARRRGATCLGRRLHDATATRRRRPGRGERGGAQARSARGVWCVRPPKRCRWWSVRLPTSSRPTFAPSSKLRPRPQRRRFRPPACSKRLEVEPTFATCDWRPAGC